MQLHFVWTGYTTHTKISSTKTANNKKKKNIPYMMGLTCPCIWCSIDHRLSTGCYQLHSQFQTVQE